MSESYAELQQQQSNILDALISIPVLREKLEAEQESIIKKRFDLSGEEAQSGKDLNGTMKPLTARKHEIRDQLEELDIRVNSAAQRLEAVESKMELARKEAIKQAKLTSQPKLEKEFLKEKQNCEDALARLAALASLTQSLPLTMLPAGRVCKMLDEGVYRSLKNSYLDELTELHNLDGKKV